jgi:hypothetical protein
VPCNHPSLWWFFNKLKRLWLAAAFAAFDPATNFSIGNARALMWFSQLAYEADTTPNPTIAVVSRLWGFTSVTAAQQVPNA